MVRLDKIYTRGGDRGETSLGDGTRTAKHSLRITAQGEVDEANAAVGLARVHAADDEAGAILARIQNDLFDLGADIARPAPDPAPDPDGDPADGNLRVQPIQVARLEREIDEINQGLAPLKSFVLRGGGRYAAHLHLACTVVRRAERAATALAAAEPVTPEVVSYLNRLSDLLFVMARQANDGGRSDVLWQPGLTAEQ
jgi:cob(I)alamin adenosyltransferase